MEKTTRIENLRMKVMGQRCSCESINNRLWKIDEDIDAVCCPKCCDCHWERAGELVYGKYESMEGVK